MRSRSWLLAALLLLSLASMGQQCSNGGDPGAASANLLGPDPISVSSQSQFSVEFAVSTTGDFRAFDVTIDWNPALLTHVSTEPHSDFDNTGQLSAPGSPDPVAGHIDSIRDVRLGGEPATGSVGVVRLWFRAESPGATQITASARVADGSGVRSAKLTTAVSVTVTP